MAFFHPWNHGVELTVLFPPSLGQRDTEPRAARSELLDQAVFIPTDLMVTAWRQLFPAERMIVFGGRTTRRGVRITSASDVTEAKPSAVHVYACPERMTRTLVDFEHTGAHLAIWMHSHPGEGPGSTYPSVTDLNQEKELRRHYSERLVNIIAVRDGWLRLWGPAVENDAVKVQWMGDGIESQPGDVHVYRVTVV